MNCEACGKPCAESEHGLCFDCWDRETSSVFPDQPPLTRGETIFAALMFVAVVGYVLLAVLR